MDNRKGLPELVRVAFTHTCALSRVVDQDPQSVLVEWVIRMVDEAWRSGVIPVLLANLLG